MHIGKRLWRAWEKLDAGLSLVGYVVYFASGAAALIAWASTTWGWYWATLNWAGVAIAFLLALMVFALSVFLIGLGIRHWRGDGDTRPSEATNYAHSSVEPTQRLNKLHSPTVTVSSPSLQAGLYVADIRMTFGDLKKDRYSEVTMRVFNGTGRVVELSGLSGTIRFSAPNDGDPSRIGELPTPAVRPDTVRTVGQLQEWLLILTQQVPAVEAEKLLAMLKADVPILFDLAELKIEVSAHSDRRNLERLPIWDGLSYRQGYGFGRVISAVGKA